MTGRRSVTFNHCNDRAVVHRSIQMSMLLSVAFIEVHCVGVLAFIMV